ncbi:MAG: polymer-forming cytoskeletal protein [bacterium]|jgi:cytoskeletal protein CcmA (bactofilin family)
MFGKASRKLETIIGDGTRIVGQVSVKGTIRIDGIVEGDLQADWVVVGETGKIVGNTRSRGMIVGGSVEGNIDATETVELSRKASMTGEIRAPKLAVSEGAVFDGRSRMKGEAEPSEAQDGKVRALVPVKGLTR